MLVEFEGEYPNVLKEDNINEILHLLKGRQNQSAEAKEDQIRIIAIPKPMLPYGGMGFDVIV